MPKIPLDSRDDLSDLLKPVSVHGKIYCRSELTSPWAVSFPKKEYAIFHVIEKGNCYLTYSDNEDAIEVRQGDVLILPVGIPHVLADRKGISAVPFLGLVQGGFKGPSQVVNYGGGGDQTNMVCGTFELESGKDNALLRVLPNVIHIDASTFSDKWLIGAMDLLAHESRNYGSGSALIISGLINLVFVQAVRQWIQNQPENNRGLLGALQDRRIAAVLTAIHNQPQKDWDVQSLAKIAGMSRSSFSAQFSSIIGQPPLSYVSYWRMQLAAQLLRHQIKMHVSEISQQVGYLSEHAFSKAFKRHHGISPSEFRTRQQA
jgi:AraC-like DNA-binding protein